MKPANEMSVSFMAERMLEMQLLMAKMAKQVDDLKAGVTTGTSTGVAAESGRLLPMQVDGASAPGGVPIPDGDLD
eukprot:6463046-Amphidinium_carterae.2